MSPQDYRTTLVVNADPDTVYRAVATRQGIAGWWTRFTEYDDRPGSEATMRFPASGFHARMRVDELVPPARVCWTCTDARHPPGVSADPGDWIGTRITFEIEPQGEGSSRLTFTHHGLRPLECADTCMDIWGFYIRQSLKRLVETGTGTPAVE